MWAGWQTGGWGLDGRRSSWVAAGQLSSRSGKWVQMKAGGGTRAPSGRAAPARPQGDATALHVTPCPDSAPAHHMVAPLPCASHGDLALPLRTTG